MLSAHFLSLMFPGMLEMCEEGKWDSTWQCARQLITWGTFDNSMDYVIALILWINCGKQDV